MSADGSVKACGKGSYGRLGLGDSNNQSMPKKLVLEPHRNMKKVSSSKGSDGHTLAITVEGEVTSSNASCYAQIIVQFCILKIKSTCCIYIFYRIVLHTVF